jgi:sialate O-acetylesterase
MSVCTFQTALADVRLPKIFTDNMVVQQQVPIRLWGWADGHEPIRVEFQGKSVSIAADGEGRWQVELPAAVADGEQYELIVAGKNRIVLKNVVLGEVWLAVGQSNMSRGLRYVKARVVNEPMDFRDLRLFFVGLDQAPRKDEPAMTKGWAPATHESMNKIFVHPTLGPYEFSEVTYYFGKAVHEKLGIPVGMISAAFPGSTAAQWTPHANPAVRFDFAAGKPDTGAGSMYQSMLVGLPPLAIRGVIYYQGENDASNSEYEKQLMAMLAAWRAKFERADLPFYMTQLGQTTFNGGTLHVSTVQQSILATVPQTGLAGSNDLFDGGDHTKAKARVDKETGFPIIGGGEPHPPNKHVVAERLARIALVQTYGKLAGEAFGPMVASSEVRGDKLVVKFKYVGKGLKTDDREAPNWFQIAGEDGKLMPAKARIVGTDLVEINADAVKFPKHFRFAWHTLARHNLYNSDSLPAMPYRSDPGK